MCILIVACSGGKASTGRTPTSGAADAWTMLGHDGRSHFDNTAEQTLSVSNAGKLAEAWQVKVGTVNGVPVVVGGRVYALAGSGTYAFDASTGAELWKNTDIKGMSSPTWDDGKLYINDRASVLHRLDAASGTEDWHVIIDANSAASGFSSPIVAGGLVIVGSASVEEVSAKTAATFRGALVAFDAATGREVWRHYTVDAPYNGVSIWSSPSVDIDLGLVYATTGNNYTDAPGPTSDSIFALDLRTGALRWTKQVSQGDLFTLPAPVGPDSDFGTNPILFDAEIGGETRHLLGAGQKSGMFWALDRETGEVVWSRKISPGSQLIGGVFNNGAYDGERIIVAGNNGTSSGPGSEPANGNSHPLAAATTPTSVLMAMNPADGSVLWERQLPAWVWAPITLANGVGFVAADRQMQAFDVATGAKLFSMETDGTISSGAAIAGGRVYFGSGIAYLGTKPDTTFHALALP
jgi:polyvinyl alcohol dehydrogenase (cytochrome)